MKTYQEKAEAYVRQQLPELMELSFGCKLRLKRSVRFFQKLFLKFRTRLYVYNGFDKALTIDHVMSKDERFIANVVPGWLDFAEFESKDGFEIIGHPIQLQHWFRVLHNTDEDFWLETLSGRLDYWSDKHKVFSFNLTTGQPATEADYQSFCEIVGINQD